MRPGPVARAVRGGLARRRVQTIVITLVLLVSTAASVLALALVVDSNAPFDHAFAAQHGAHLAVTVDSGRATPAQLAATTRLAGVTAAAGPFAEASVTLSVPVTPPSPRARGGGNGPTGGTATVTLPTKTLVGRADPGGPVDRLQLRSGRWPQRAGELVLAEGDLPPGVQPGVRVTVTDAPGTPALTLVGIATSITGTAGGWVVPEQIPALLPPGTGAQAQLLYRFRDAGTDAALRADAAAVRAALPSGTVTGTQTYLAAKVIRNANIAPFVPFLVAFGVIGMVMSVLIVGNVVSGAVVTGYRRIGVLKSIGFSPAQVVAAYTGQVALPALVGAAVGVLAGNLLSVPLLRETAGVYGVGALRVPTWVNVAVPAGMLALAGIAAVLPALRAGRLSAVQAIAMGRAPRASHGYRAHRLLARLPLPRPVTIGLAAPFARPTRAVVTLVAILLGATTVTLTAGLSSSLGRIVIGLSHSTTQQVQVTLPSAGTNTFGTVRRMVPGSGGTAPPMPTAAQAQTAVEAALRSLPGTLHQVAQTDRAVSVSGVSQAVQVTGFHGDATWAGYDLIRGHWYTAPGEVVVASHLLTATGASIGDSITMTSAGRRATVRIVGEVFDTENDALHVITDARTLSALVPDLTPEQYDIQLTAGTSPSAYVQSLEDRLGSAYLVRLNSQESDIVTLMIGLIGTLTVLLAIVAGLGVLNTVVLHTRERVHDLGVFKAVGMTPRQAVVMVVCWVAGSGLVAGLIAVPLGLAVHRQVLPAMAGSVGLGLPSSYLDVYRWPELAVLALAGVVIAVAGALLPATWAAATRTSTALRAE